MTKYLGQTYKIAWVILQVFVRHGVAKEMRVDLLTDDGTVFIANRSDAFLRQRPAFPNEDPTARHRRSGLQVGLKGTAGRKRQRYPAFLGPLPKPERSTAFTDLQGVEFQIYKITTPATGVEATRRISRRPMLVRSLA